ncbi:MAG: hypothetical protein ABI837_05000 [Acidobacteriota bacterium]
MLTNQSTTSVEQLQHVAEAAVAGKQVLAAGEWRSALSELAIHLQRPMSLSSTERVERVLKAYLRAIFRLQLAGDDARFIAKWQRDLGFLLKFKSYGVKCATPLGYSLFFQNPGEGFSFQRHLTHKTEIFCILKPLDGALVFLCSSNDWESLYDRCGFQRWLNGARDANLAKFATRPCPGDVYHVSELGVIHSVLGCILEEFATVSTDMVDRLHDQNAGRNEPQVARDAVVTRLRNLGASAPRIAASDGKPAGVIVHDGDVLSYRLGTGAIDATRVHMTRARVEVRAHTLRARILFTVKGSASCIIRGNGDSPGVTPPAIDVRGGDLLMIAPGFDALIATRDAAVFSIHAIEPEIALV